MSAFLASALLALSPAQAPPVFRAEVDLVRVEVLVTRDGAPLPGLRAADFEVRDNGVGQELEPVVEEQSPVDAALVLDMSGSVQGSKLEALRGAARAFLEGLHQGEQAALVAFREEVRLVEPFTVDRDRVLRALGRVEPLGSTALHDAVYAALRLREPGPRRTAVVVFSDGIDSLSWLGGPEVVEAATRSDAIVYGVTVRGGRDVKDPFVRDVVRATGGQAFEASGERELKARFLEVLAAIRSRYVLSYTPRGGEAPGFHTLEVKLKRVKGEVLTRPGYWRYESRP